MSHEPESREPLPPEIPGDDVTADSATDSGDGDAVRKLRYDAPSLEIPRPLYLRSDGPGPDEEAA